MVIFAITFGVIGLGLSVVKMVDAQFEGNYPPIIQKLVERFGLNEDEVKAVFDEAREEKQGQMQAHFEERLNQAVVEGEITEEQKQAILNKHEEMKTNRQANRGEFKNLTTEEREERKEKMQAHREEMKAWAEENGIDSSLLPMLLGGGRKPGFGGPGFGGPNSDK